MATPVALTPAEFYATGKAMDAEMRLHLCSGPKPNFTPHDAYDRFTTMLNQLKAAEVAPLDFFKESLASQPLPDTDTPLMRNLRDCPCGCTNYSCDVQAGSCECELCMSRDFDLESEDMFVAETRTRQGCTCGCEDTADDREPGVRCPCGCEDTSDDDDEDGDEDQSQEDDSDEEYTDGDSDEESGFFGREMDYDDGLKFVTTLEHVLVKDVPPEDMQCGICLDRFDDEVPDRDDSPVWTPCCRQLFGQDCLIAALVDSGVRCPKCRQDIVDIAVRGGDGMRG